MSKNPYLLPPNFQNTSPLAWEMFRYRARPQGNRGAAAVDLQGLLRHAVEGEMPLDLEHEGLSLLGAALSDWGSVQLPVPAEPSLLLPVPGQPSSGVLGAGIDWPEAIAGVLIHRGADPFVHWSRLLNGEEIPDLHKFRPTTSLCLCPVSLTMEGGLDNTLNQMLRHPNSPPADQWDALRADRLPWLHVAVSIRPRILLPLLNHGLNPNIRDPYGRTPLFLASNVGQVTQLIAAGADPSLTSENGRTAADFWREKGIKDVLKMTASLVPTGAPPPRAAIPAVFDDVFYGKRSRVPKASEPMPLAICVPEFQEPLSLLSQALLGVLANVSQNPEELLTMLFERSEMGATERALLAIATSANPVHDPAYYEQKHTMEKRQKKNRWRSLLNEKAAQNPSTAKIIHAIVPQAVEFLANRFPDLKQAAEVATDLSYHLKDWEALSPMPSILWHWTALVDQRAKAGNIGLPAWNPWGNGWNEYRKNIPPLPRSMEPEAVVHMLCACLRDLESGSGANSVTAKLQKGLEVKLNQWSAGQWDALDRTGMLATFENRMQQSEIDAPWLPAWKARRRQIKAQESAPASTTISRPRLRP